MDIKDQFLWLLKVGEVFITLLYDFSEKMEVKVCVCACMCVRLCVHVHVVCVCARLCLSSVWLKQPRNTLNYVYAYMCGTRNVGNNMT